MCCWLCDVVFFPGELVDVVRCFGCSCVVISWPWMLCLFGKIRLASQGSGCGSTLWCSVGRSWSVMLLVARLDSLEHCGCGLVQGCQLSA